MSIVTGDKLIIYNLGVNEDLSRYLDLLRERQFNFEQRFADGSPDYPMTELLFEMRFPVEEYGFDVTRPYQVITRFNSGGLPFEQLFTGMSNGWTQYPAYDLIAAMLYSEKWELVKRTRNHEDPNDLSDTFEFTHKHKAFRVVAAGGTDILITNLDA